MTGYPELLRDAINDAKTSRRQLSVRLAEETGNQQTSEYRALGKYLSGDEAPTKERAAILAVLLLDHRLALVSDGQRRRQARLEDIADAVAELLENQQEVLGLLKDALPATREQRHAAGRTPKTNR